MQHHRKTNYGIAFIYFICCWFVKLFIPTVLKLCLKLVKCTNVCRVVRDSVTVSSIVTNIIIELCTYLGVLNIFY